MKFYVYSKLISLLPKHIAENERLKKIFSYTRLILDGKEEKTSSKADYFIVPTLFLFDDFNKIESSDELMSDFCNKLPYWKGNKEKHIFLDQSDECKIPTVLKNSLLFTTSPMSSEPLHRALPFYPYKHEWLDVPKLLAKPFSESRFDLFFKGCGDNMPIRKQMTDCVSIYERNGLSAYVKTYSRYFWSQDLSDTKKAEERKHYFERMTDSKFVLCPRGRGTTSSRFFEAVYFGRIPVLISDDYRLPLENKIAWDEMIVRVKTHELPFLHENVYSFIKTHDLTRVSLLLKDTAQKYLTRETMFKMIRETFE